MKKLFKPWSAVASLMICRLLLAQKGLIFPIKANYARGLMNDDENFLTDEIDHEILMHRDAHFGGSFDEMLRYYENEGVGVHPEIDLERIQYLQQVEQHEGINLAPVLLSGPEAERVARARQKYQDFKTIYEEPKMSSRYARLIADLVLTEDEEPEEEIEAIVKEGAPIVPDLIRILGSDDAYDPLFPGYGYAPLLAIRALGRLKSAKAIAPLFETIGKESLFDDDAALSALRQIGEPAKEFLLKQVSARPLTRDTLSAAYALSAFDCDEQIKKTCLDQLKDPQVQQNKLLSSYLRIVCEG